MWVMMEQNFPDDVPVGVREAFFEVFPTGLSSPWLEAQQLEFIQGKHCNAWAARFWRYGLLPFYPMSGWDLSKKDLRGADLSGLDLSRANLEEADLRDVILFDTNLQGANLKGAHLGGALLWNTDFREAELGDSHLRDVRFVEGAIVKGLQVEAFVTNGLMPELIRRSMANLECQGRRANRPRPGQQAAPEKVAA